MSRRYRGTQMISKPSPVNQPVRTACTFVHHYNSTQYCSTETVLLIFPFFQTNITSQMWPSGGKGLQFMQVPTASDTTTAHHMRSDPDEVTYCMTNISRLTESMTCMMPWRSAIRSFVAFIIRALAAAFGSGSTQLNSAICPSFNQRWS